MQERCLVFRRAAWCLGEVLVMLEEVLAMLEEVLVMLEEVLGRAFWPLAGRARQSLG